MTRRVANACQNKSRYMRHRFLQKTYISSPCFVNLPFSSLLSLSVSRARPVPRTSSLPSHDLTTSRFQESRPQDLRAKTSISPAAMIHGSPLRPIIFFLLSFFLLRIAGSPYPPKTGHGYHSQFRPTSHTKDMAAAIPNKVWRLLSFKHLAVVNICLAGMYVT